MDRPTILTVDDDPVVSAAISRDLRGRYGTDYRIVTATSGTQALEALADLAGRNQSVALIASDQRMPEMTGIELLERARTHAEGAKYLLLTAYADTDVAIRAINDIGLDRYLLKPWDPPAERLYPVIDELLGDWRRTNPPTLLVERDIRAVSLFDGLNDEQLAELIEAGTVVTIEPGVDLFREGEHADFWWVLIDGAIELRRRVGREENAVGRMDVPGRWAGGFRAWDDHGVYLATGRGIEAGRVLRVATEALRDFVNRWFPLGGHLIRGLYGTARTIESTVRQRESLVTLGTLAAGLAHEINNPAAAATRAADSLADTCRTLASVTNKLIQAGISAGQFAAVEALRHELQPASLGPLALADAEDTLTGWLEDHGVERDWVIAPTLAAGGADVLWCDRVASALDDASLEPALEWVAATISANTLLPEVKESTKRISELVAAVRSYSQMDRGSLQRVDVTDGIESTLTMLGHRLRDGVEVVRDYGEVPRIEAYAGELNQVWTKLIDNAVDAMDGKGILTITTRAEDDGVLVEITDTGTGMPAEVAARAFEAFYTTKDVGKGTGLGLDIARRIIVERHSGDISITSTPGHTTFTVHLPAKPLP